MQDHEKLAQKIVMENARSFKLHGGNDIEYILFYEIKTKKFISCHTDFSKNMAGVHAHIKDLLAQDKQLALHHNHPTGKNLSTGDYKVIAQFPNIVEIWAHVEIEDPQNPYRHFKASARKRELLNSVLEKISVTPINDRELKDFTWALNDALLSKDIILFDTDFGNYVPTSQNAFTNAKMDILHKVNYCEKAVGEV